MKVEKLRKQVAGRVGEYVDRIKKKNGEDYRVFARETILETGCSQFMIAEYLNLYGYTVKGFRVVPLEK